MTRKQIDMKQLHDRVVTSGKELNAVMEQLIEAAADKAEQIGRGVMLELYGELVGKVPKDTSRTATGFNINEMPSEWTPPPGDYNDRLGQESEENRQRLLSIPPGHTVTISNNVEYLPVLEDGHSRKAPSGFLAAAIRWAARQLEIRAAKFSKKRL